MSTKMFFQILGILMIGVLLMTASCSSGSTQPSSTTPKTSITSTTTGTTASNPSTPTTSKTSTTTTSSKPKTYASAPAMIIDKNKQYTATLETEKGNLVIELFAKDVPVTVNNFVFLARDGYYDGCTFHRVLSGFMAQTGDPTGTGSGGPGYYIKNEITSHKHVKGAVSMARTSLPDTNGSQFFICYEAQTSLDGLYSVFGQLIQGADVLLKITPRDPTKNPTYTGDKIHKITIEEK
jgi:cyclophilin family peptidyl-prolyl cis-trans isomerase